MVSVCGLFRDDDGGFTPSVLVPWWWWRRVSGAGGGSDRGGDVIVQCVAYREMDRTACSLLADDTDAALGMHAHQPSSLISAH